MRNAELRLIEREAVAVAIKPIWARTDSSYRGQRNSFIALRSWIVWRPLPRQTILPPDLFERFSNMAFWRDLKGSKAFRIVTQPSTTQASTTQPSQQMPEAITTNPLA